MLTFLKKLNKCLNLIPLVKVFDKSNDITKNKVSVIVK